MKNFRPIAISYLTFPVWNLTSELRRVNAEDSLTVTQARFGCLTRYSGVSTSYNSSLRTGEKAPGLAGLLESRAEQGF